MVPAPIRYPKDGRPGAGACPVDYSVHSAVELLGPPDRDPWRRQFLGDEIAGHVGCIVIKPDGSRVLARAVPDPLAE